LHAGTLLKVVKEEIRVRSVWDDKVNDGGIYVSSLCQLKNVPLTLSSRVFDWSRCLSEEADDFPGNKVRVVFEREMACIEQVELCLRNVAQICPCAFNGEEGIILAPDDERLRLPVPEERLPFRVVREIGLVGNCAVG
jgi:hypothetical protein